MFGRGGGGGRKSSKFAHSLRNAANEIKIRVGGGGERGGSERAERVSERGEGIASAA